MNKTGTGPHPLAPSPIRRGERMVLNSPPKPSPERRGERIVFNLTPCPLS